MPTVSTPISASSGPGVGSGASWISTRPGATVTSRRIRRLLLILITTVPGQACGIPRTVQSTRTLSPAAVGRQLAGAPLVGRKLAYRRRYTIRGSQDSSRQSVRPDLIDAAVVDGTNRWQTFRYVELPAIRPVLVVVIVLSIINGLKGFDLVFAMTNGGPADSSQLLAAYAWTKSVLHHDVGLGSAVASFLFLLTIAVIVPYIRGTLRGTGDEA